MRDLVIVTITFYVFWSNRGIWELKQKTATGLLLTNSKKITLNDIEHVKHNRKKMRIIFSLARGN